MEEKKQPQMELGRHEIIMLYNALYEFKDKLERIERPTSMAQSTVQVAKQLLEKMEQMVLEIGE